MAVLIPRKQIEEQKDFTASLDIGGDLTVSGSLLVSKSFFLGSRITDKSEITGSVFLTGSLNIDGEFTIKDAATTVLSFTSSQALEALESFDTTRYAGVLARDFGANVPTLYVSATDGDDTNDGRTIQFPLRTIKRAAELATPGFDGRYGLPSGSNFSGYVIRVQAGTYVENNPVILPKNASIWGSGLRITKILAQNPSEDLFHVNSGCYVAEVTMGGLRLFPDQINPEKGFAIAFQPGAFITTSPYIQNCSQISNQENSFTELYEDIPPGGGGLYVNGDVINPDSPLASMVLDAYTQISPNGVGCLVNGRGFIQLVSFFTNFAYYAIRVNNGGHATLNNSNISFGLFGMYASGSRKIDAITGGNEDARRRVRASYSVIVDVLNKGLEEGLPTITTLNTDEGIKVTAVTQSYTVADASQTEINKVTEDFRLVSEIVKSGVDNYPALLAKSSNKGYDINNPYNILGATQITSSISASAGDLTQLSSSYAAILSIFADGTGSYTFESNTADSIKVGDIAVQIPQNNAEASTISNVSSSFATILNIINGGNAPTIVSNNSASLQITPQVQYVTGIACSGSTINSVSASFSIIYNILDNGTGSSILPIPENHQTSFDVTLSGSNAAYEFEGVGANPTLTLFRGQTYKFYVSASIGKDVNPLFIRTQPISGFTDDYDYQTGVVNNGEDFGNITFTVPFNAPNELYYVSQNSSAMVGKFNIVNSDETPFELIANTLTYPKLVSTGSVASLDADIHNAYNILRNNKTFIQEETIAFVSSSWSDFSYNEVTCKRDIGFIIDAVSNDLLYGGNSESITAGLFYYLYPSDATTTQKDPTLTAIKYVSGIAQNLLKNIQYRSILDEVDLLILKDISDTILANREFFQTETIAYLSSSWSTFDYNEAKCRRDVGYMVDAVATDILFKGNERSVTAGNFYYKYPSEATTTQLTQTLDGVKFLAGSVKNVISQSPTSLYTTASASTQAAYNLLRDNKQLIQNETIQFINTTYPTLEYNSVSCSRDVGFIVDAVATDLLYGGIERGVKAGRFYYDVPSVATSLQKKETIAGIAYAKVLSEYIVQNTILETPSIIKNTESLIKVSALNNITSSVSGTESESNKITQRFNIIQDIIRKGTLSTTAALAKNTDLNWGVANVLSVSTSSQATSSFQLPSELDKVVDGWNLVSSIIEGGIPAIPALTSSADGLIKITNTTQETGSAVSSVVTSSISSSFGTVIDILENGLTAIPTISLNTAANIQVSAETLVSGTPATNSESASISSSFGTIINVLNNGVSALPVLTQNTAGNFKVSATPQYISASYNATQNNISFLSSSFNIVTQIIKTGNLDLFEREDYVTRATDNETVAAYEILKQNIDFIQDETIAYLSSSWRGFDYNEAKCRRDIGYILSGSAEDLIYGVNNQSIVNGQFYYEFPSQATDIQLEQTLDGINYAARLAQKVITNTVYGTQSANKLNAADLIVKNKQFIQEETIAYISSSWSSFEYNEVTCKRDVGYIIDAVATDLIYGGNERTRKAAEFYFLYPSDATGSQLIQTVDAINYASRLAKKISVGETFTLADSDNLEASRLLKANANLIANEVVEYVSSSWSGVSYNEVKCKRDVGYILDAIRTDLVYGGNERTAIAGEFYFLYPSAATVGGVPSVTAQLDPTVTGINYASRLAQNIVLSNVLTNPSQPILDVAELIRANRGLLQSSTIDYISYAYPDFVYDTARCFRDVGFITDGVVTDLVYGGNERSSTSGYFYFKFPSEATTAQVQETVDAIRFARDLSKVIAIEAAPIEKSFTNVINIVKNGRTSIPTIVETTLAGIKGTNEVQTTLSSSANQSDVAIVSSSFANVINIISNGTGSIPTIIPVTQRGVNITGDTQITSSVSASASDIAKVGSGFDVVLDIIENGTGSIPTIITNADNNIKRTNLTSYTTASIIPSTLITASNSSFDVVLDIVENGTGSIPYLVKNTIALVKTTNTTQFTSSLISSNETVTALNFNFDIVLDIVENGTGSYTSSIIPYATASTDVDILSAYNVLKANIPFIVSESIAYLSSSWSTFVYNQASCSRDIAFIVSGAAEDLLWGSNSASIVNGKFYYDFPSEATGSQLQQTLDGIQYAKNLSDRLARKAVFQSVSNDKLKAKELIVNNKNFIANEVVAYVSASWAGFGYNEVTCKRDVGFILDAVITDIVYGGNERSIEAGRYYYDYPSQAITTQLGPTLSGITHAKNLTKQILKNSTFVTPSTSAQTAYQLLMSNKQFIQDETIAFVSSSWSMFNYNEASCSRDTGYIVDAVATDIFYGGNESAARAGEYYYLYPSLAIVEGDGNDSGQLDQTLDGVKYAKSIAQKIVSNTLLQSASISQLAGYNLLRQNKQLIQRETIAFLSSSWSGVDGFSYNEQSCSRDVAYIIDNVATDLLYGGNERSSKAGEYYFLYPSAAIVSGSVSPTSTAQLGPTVDGIKFAAATANKVIQNITLVTASQYVLDTTSLLTSNRRFIQNETIEFVDAFYPYLRYNREKCRRDVGFILDAAITDLKYGGNERSAVAGEYYYRYPNKATTSEQLTETLLAIFYAKELAKTIAQNSLLGNPEIGLNIDGNIKVTSVTQYTSSISASNSEVNNLSASISTINTIIRNGESSIPTLVKNVNGLVKVNNNNQITSSISASVDDIAGVISGYGLIRDIVYNGTNFIGDALVANYSEDYGFHNQTPTVYNISALNQILGNISGSNTSSIQSEINDVTSSYDTIINIVSGGLGELPIIVKNTNDVIKVTNEAVFTSVNIGSNTDITKANTLYNVVLGIIESGSSAIPTLYPNSTSSIKVTNTPQIFSSSYGERIHGKIVSASFGLVANILENGTGSVLLKTGSLVANTNPKVINAYTVLVNNADFIIDETIAFMSSSWSGFDYNQATCERDLGYIISGSAYDLLYGGNSASFANGREYLLQPSMANDSQLDQTLTAIGYAGGVAEKVLQGMVYAHISASALQNVSASYVLMRNNKSFIVSESIAFLSSSWSEFQYNQASCSRDVAYIIDAVSTDLLYGGNERSIVAGDYYYRFPSEATGSQLQQTLDGIEYSKGLVINLISGSTPQTASVERQYVYDLISDNREFIRTEGLAYVKAKYEDLIYDDDKCFRDLGYILDAVRTDVLYGGNERTAKAGEFYYLYPSLATDSQLTETLDAINYTGLVTDKVIKSNLIAKPEIISNNELAVKVTNASQYITGSGFVGTLSEVASISSSIAIVMDIVENGTASYSPTPYTTPSNDPNVLNAYNLLIENISFIQSESIAYVSSSWSTFAYDETKCKRDIGFIVSGAAEDLLYGSTSASIVNGKFYYEYPSEATGSQLQQTLDGIRYASGMAQKIVLNTPFVTPSSATSASYGLLRNNKTFIADEVVSYVSSSWSSASYIETTCKRDVGFLIDAVSTDILYGGNERSVIAGRYYYDYPSQATTTQKEPTATAIEYAADLSSNIIQNNVFETASSVITEARNVLRLNKPFIQAETIAYISSSWSQFAYNEASCSRDTGFIVDAIATDLLYGGNERSSEAGRYYYLFPSEATTAQLEPTIDGITYAGRIAQKVIKNVVFQTASLQVSASVDLLRKNRAFVQAETIEYVSSSWSQVAYNEASCSRDVGFIVDAVTTDLLYGGEERTVNAADFYYRFPSRATVAGVPSEANQLDPTLTGIRYAGGVSSKLILNNVFTAPSQSVLTAKQLIINNKRLIQAETIAFLSSSWSTLEYNEVSCSRDVGYIIDGVVTDLVYGGNESSIQAGSYYYFIPSVAIQPSYTDNGKVGQKIQTVDGINFARGVAEKVVAKKQLVFPGTRRLDAAQRLVAAKNELKRAALSYTNGAFPFLVYNEASCSRDTGLIVDALATDLIYGGNERGIAAASSYYNGQYGSAIAVTRDQRLETLETNRYLRTKAEFIAANAPKENFGSLIVATGIDYSYNGSGVTFKALPPNQGGSGVPNPDFEITELGGGRIFFTSGNQDGDFRIGTGLSINQATGTLVGRTFSKSLFSLVTPFSLALEG
jgi:hypothetical protein